MSPVNSRAKGVRGELHVRDLLSLLWPEAIRGASQGGGAQYPDVDKTPFWVESKNAVLPNIWRAMEQAVTDARAAKDPRPAVVVAHRTRGPQECRGVICFREEDFARVAMLFAEGVAHRLAAMTAPEPAEVPRDE